VTGRGWRSGWCTTRRTTASTTRSRGAGAPWSRSGGELAQQPEGDPATGTTHELAEDAPPGQEAGGRLRGRRPPEQEGDEALRSPPATLRRPALVRHHHQAAAVGPAAGSVISAARLTGRWCDMQERGTFIIFRDGKNDECPPLASWPSGQPAFAVA